MSSEISCLGEARKDRSNDRERTCFMHFQALNVSVQFNIQDFRQLPFQLLSETNGLGELWKVVTQIWGNLKLTSKMGQILKTKQKPLSEANSVNKQKKDDKNPSMHCLTNLTKDLSGCRKEAPESV